MKGFGEKVMHFVEEKEKRMQRFLQAFNAFAKEVEYLHAVSSISETWGGLRWSQFVDSRAPFDMINTIDGFLSILY